MDLSEPHRGFFRLTETLCVAELISCPRHTLGSSRLSALRPSSSSQEDERRGRLQEPSGFPGTAPELLAAIGLQMGAEQTGEQVWRSGGSRAAPSGQRL